MDTKRLILLLKENNKSHVGYGLQKESEALMGHILKNMSNSKLPEFEAEMKNSEDSICYREEGNQHFVSGDDTEAIESYTKSLAYADNQELMAYAHANRSAALYRKQMFKECLIDVDTALSLGYPEEKRQKLTERGVKALAEIQKRLEIENFLPEEDNTLGSIFGEKDNKNNSKKFKLIKPTEEKIDVPPKDNEIIKNGNINSTSMEATTAKTGNSKEPRYLADEGHVKLVYGSSKEAPVASDGVEIAFSEKFGRHFIATRDFNPGDVITIEKPYACVIYQERPFFRFYTHCHHCLTRSYNLIPCIVCPVAQYCSEECRKAAWSSVHHIECSILALLNSLLGVDKDKIRMLMKVLRLLINVTNGGKAIAELRQDMKIAESNKDDRTAGFTDEGILDTASARSALSLATNMTGRPLIGISAFACISALTGVLLATQTTFFGKRYLMENLANSDIFADLTFCGSIMLRASVIMSSNCFSIQQEPSIKSGSGLYVVHSLYNHSCAPNTFRHFEGLTMITRVLEPIHPGEQIFACYGADCAYLPKEERKKKLMEEYFFDCECPGCLGDWPTYKDILKNHIGSIAKNKELVERIKPLKKRLLENKYDIEAVKAILRILHGEVTKPCEELIHGLQYIKSYYLDL
ncbi:SET and MYND domain-containing protein 4 isoform X2 [Cephus cinctus]|uniref:SET and MYND domain-containing protein 4 isoform X2 n=1 Tax=Cephus cinctus TaxID=211228 RepID=A0AAJ7R7Y5_CEPCN|nr:SET and MYND domain-containing protein 4 isoform X2 [Cephus cinctus]